MPRARLADPVREKTELGEAQRVRKLVVIRPFSHSGFPCLSGNLGSDSAGTEMESSLKTQRVND